MFKAFLPVLFLLLTKATTAQTDTLISFFNPLGETLIESPNGGFLSGSNGFQDSEKLQSFFPSGSYSILGLLVWNGYVVNNSMDSTSVVNFKIRNLDTSATSVFPFFRGPTQTIDSVDVKISDLQASSSFEDGLSYIAFNSPVLITAPYLAGFNLEGLHRNEEGEFVDSFAVRSTALDSALLPGFSWERWDGVFKRIVDSWGVNVDFALFPVIDTTLNGVTELHYTKLKAYPNPCSDYVTIQMAESNPFTEAQLVNLSGRVIRSYSVSEISGNYTLNLPAVSSGIYTIRLIGNKDYSVIPIIIQ